MNTLNAASDDFMILHHLRLHDSFVVSDLCLPTNFKALSKEFGHRKERMTNKRGIKN
jgi:hypothetical protein